MIPTDIIAANVAKINGGVLPSGGNPIAHGASSTGKGRADL
jgi:hypothetical protein